jgi:hypothetical protein
MAIINKFKGPCRLLLKPLNLDKDEEERRLNRLLNVIKKSTSQATIRDLSKELKAEVHKMSLEYELEVQIRHLNEINNIRVFEETKTRLYNFGSDVHEGLLSILHGSNRRTATARESIDSEGKGLLKTWVAGYLKDFEEIGGLPMIKSGKFDKDIMQAVYELRSEGVLKKGNPNPLVKKVAEVIDKWSDITITALNQAGARVEKTVGHSFRMMHDSQKIRKATFQVWAQKASKYFNLKEMAKRGNETVPDMLRQIYEELASNHHLRSEGENAGTLPVGLLSSEANMARKVSMRSKLIFKSGEDHYNYIKEFGDESQHLMDSLVFGLEHTARDVALMNNLGTNPKNMLKMITRNAMDELREAGEYEVLERDFTDLVEGIPKRVYNSLKELDGSARIPGNPTFAKWSSFARIVKNMALLGGVVLRSVNDLNTILSEGAHQGFNWGSAVKITVDRLTGDINPHDMKKLSSIVAVGQEALMADVIGKFSGNDFMNGTLTRMQRMYFKANLLTFWNDALKSSFAMMEAHHLGLHHGVSLADMAKSKNGKQNKLAKVLDNAGIGTYDWDLARSVMWKDSKGRMMFTPDRLEELSDDTIRKYLHDSQVKEIDPNSTRFFTELKKIEDNREKHRQLKMHKDNNAHKRDKLVEQASVSRIRRQRIMDARAEAIAARNKANDLLSMTKANEYDLKADVRVEIEKHNKAIETFTKKIDDLEANGKRLEVEIQKLKKLSDEDVIKEKKLNAQFKLHTPDKDFSDAQIKRARNKLVSRFRTFFQDRNDFAVLIPGARERSFFHQGLQPGTLFGEAARFIAQFKTFPLTVMTKPLERDILAGGADSILQGLNPMNSAHADYWALGKFIAGMTIFGAAGMALSDRAKGVTTRDWTSIDTMHDAAILGGSLGLYTDFVLGPYGTNKYDALNAFAGPVLGQFPDLISVTTGALNGDPQAKKRLNIAMSIAPGLNLFYIRRMVDYFIWFNIQEAIEPGAVFKKQERLRKRTGQQYLIPPRLGGGNPVDALNENPQLAIPFTGGAQ